MNTFWLFIFVNLVGWLNVVDISFHEYAWVKVFSAIDKDTNKIFIHVNLVW